MNKLLLGVALAVLILNASGPTGKTSPVNVLIVGDSISQYQLITTGGLKDQLQGAGYTITGTGYATFSDAFPGFTSNNLYTLIGGTPHPAADIILTQSGTNDIIFYGSNVAQAKTDRRNLLIRLRTLYPSATIYVNPVTPMVSSQTARNANIVSLNTDTKAFITANPSMNLIWTGDFLSTDWPDSVFQPDGIHPNSAQLVWLSDRWMVPL